MKKNEMLEKIKSGQKLNTEMFSQIKYINLHAHSTYSLQDAVGQVSDHFVKTIEAGHCGCCMTDHGSYASFIDLHNLKNNKIGNKKVAKIFEEKGMNHHPVVTGSELYIIDDRHVKILDDAISNNDLDLCKKTIEKMSTNPKWDALFREEKKSVISINNDENKSLKTSKVGAILLDKLQNNKEVTTSDIKEYNQASLKCKSYKYNHITIMAKSEIGHSNICHLTSIGSLPEKYYSRPRITLSDLLEHKEGLVVTSGCFVGMIPQAIHKKTGEESELVQLFLNEFGEDFYIEMHVSDISFVWDSKTKTFVKQEGVNPQKIVNDRLLELVREFKLEDKVYITQDSHMPNKTDKEIQDIVILNSPGNSSGWHFYNTYSIMSVEEMYQACKKNYPEYTDEDFVRWCYNTIEVLEKCRNVELDNSLKFIKPDYDNHPVNNPFRVHDDLVKEKYKDLDIIDRYLKIDSLQKEALEGTISPDEEYLINKDLTEKARILNDQSEKEMRSILETKTYHIAKVKKFIDKEIDLRTVVKQSVQLKKIDFSNPEQRDRFFADLDIVQFNGALALSDYFMVIEDTSRFVVYADEFKGPGRGSAAGCMVSYTIDVTDINPPKYSLLMERFLQAERVGVTFFDVEGVPYIKKENYTYEDFERQQKQLEEIKSLIKNPSPEIIDEINYIDREMGVIDYIYDLYKSGKVHENKNNSHLLYALGVATKPNGTINKTEPAMPDIDYDSSCRDLICEYLIRKNGRDKTAYIGSYTTLKVKSAIKDVLRVRPVNGVIMTPVQVNALTKEYDKVKLSEKDASKGEKFLFEKVKSENSSFRRFFDENPSINDDVSNILGTYKGMGIHAAGIILSPTEITRSIPCTWDKEKNAYVTQLAKDEVEMCGFIKLDELGITTGEDIRDCAKLIRERHGKDYFGKWEHIIDNLPPNVAEGYVNVKTVSVFQMNTPVAIDLLTRVRKQTNPVEENAMYTSALRPGPMSARVHLDLVDVRNGTKKVNYLHPKLEPFLSETFGMLVYQEQVMQICISLGGFTKFEADKIRKAMGKKKFGLLEKFEKQFVKYAHKNEEIPKDTAKAIWDNMAAFAEYGFNKSHAICYSAVSAICMYFKENYPLEWMASVFARSSRKDTEKDKQNYKRFYREWKKYLKTPNIALSGDSYNIHNDHIYMPLYSSDAIKMGTARKYKNAFEKSDGTYKSFVLWARALEVLDKTSFEALIDSGALDYYMPKIDYSKSVEEQKDKINTVIDFANRVLLKDIEKIETDSVEDLLGIEGQKEESRSIDDFKELFSNIGLNKFQFRKYLKIAYYEDYRNIKLKKGLKDLLVEKKLYTPRIVYNIMFYQNVMLKGSEFDKYRGVNSKGNSNSVNVSIPKKEKEALQVLKSDLLPLPNKKILKNELKLLKFTSYDFSLLFKDELTRVQNSNTKIEYLKDIERKNNQIISRVSKIRESLNEVIGDKVFDLGIAKAKAIVILKILAEVSENLGSWQIDVLCREVSAKIMMLDSYGKALMSLALESELNINRMSLNLKNIGFQDLNITKKRGYTLQKSHQYILKYILQSNLDIRTINSIGYYNISYADISKLMLVAQFCKDGENLLKNIKATTGAKKNLSEKYQRLVKICALKRKGSEENVVRTIEELNIKTDISGELIYFTEDEIGVYQQLLKKYESRAFFSEEEKKFMNTTMNVFGTCFREVKKNFIKEYKNSYGTSKTMNFFLNDSEHQINVSAGNFEKISCYTKEGNKGLVDIVEDFNPTILPLRPQYNLFRDSIKLKLQNKEMSKYIHVEDLIA